VDALSGPIRSRRLSMQVREKHTIAVLLLLAAMGAICVFYATAWGVGVSPDSTLYLEAARNLLRGHGLTITTLDNLTRPLTHYPPLYPYLLYAGGRLGIDPMDGARWLSALLFGANIFLVGYAILKFGALRNGETRKKGQTKTQR
jgi:hypothetical protein